MQIRRFVSGCSVALAVWGALASTPAQAATQVLYDYTLAPDLSYDPTTPNFLASMFVNAAQSVAADGSTINPGNLGNTGYGGYSNHNFTQSIVSFSPLVFQVGTGGLVNPAFPVLDRNAGFSLTFGMRMQGEDHSGNSNRAGFSITLLDSEHKGVEIGFQNNRIFAQNDGTLGTTMFTAGEQTTAVGDISALGAFNTWNLSVTGSGYSLTRAGSVVLSGALRDYSAYTGLGQDAYRTTNFLFVGDNTTSAGATTTLQYLAIGPAPVPEPSAYMMLLAGLGCISLVAYRRRTVRA
jgi:hypothetical protein